MRKLRWSGLAAAIALLSVVAVAWMFANARALPVVRRIEIGLPFPADAPRTPVKVLLLTDAHLSEPDNGPARMDAIVDRINALKPDLVVLGGDYIGDWKGGATYDAAASIAPFARLRAPLGVVAVTGNHDIVARPRSQDRRLPNEQAWAKAYGRIGVRLLSNRAVRRGPIAVGGLADIYTGRPDVPATLSAMRALGGAPLLLSHSPDIFTHLSGHSPLLLLVGHTHCGQIALPGVGALYVPSAYGTRYACGVYRRGRATMIVSAGVGTSRLPLRAFAPPDIWLITLRPL